MAKAAESDELRQAFEKHRAETEGHVERLEEVFEAIGKKAQGKTCEAIQGIIEEGKEIMEDFAESEALDAGLIAAAQAVEHYEISRYGTLRTWAQELGLTEAAGLLEQTLAEEKKTDQALSRARRGAGQPEGRLTLPAAADPEPTPPARAGGVLLALLTAPGRFAFVTMRLALAASGDMHAARRRRPWPDGGQHRAAADAGRA